MGEGVEGVGGFTLLDGAALVVGAAVASVHVRAALPGDRLPGAAWGLVWATLAGVALTAAGPFLFLVRRFVRRVPGYPRVGDALWAVLGLPWLVAALVKAAESAPPRPGRGGDLYATSITAGVAVASLIALVVVWRTWVSVAPEDLEQSGPRPWTDVVGLALAVAWPLQCGLGLVVAG